MGAYSRWVFEVFGEALISTYSIFGGWGGGCRLFEFEWEWKGGGVGWGGHLFEAGRLFEVGANSSLGAYSNKYSI